LANPLFGDNVRDALVGSAGFRYYLTPQSEQDADKRVNNRIARHFVLGVAAIPQPFPNSKLATVLADSSL
jgi:hypothetical protein